MKIIKWLQEIFWKITPQKRVGRYVELEEEEEYKEWGLLRWLMFVAESMYMTILPFIAGVMLVEKRQLFWLIFLILPVWIKFKVSRQGKGKIKIYLK